MNAEIRETLKAESGRMRFAILNNGVTVVARRLQTTGNKFAVTDYQIVNGVRRVTYCSIRRRNWAKNSDSLKVIATEDERSSIPLSLRPTGRLK